MAIASYSVLSTAGAPPRRHLPGSSLPPRRHLPGSGLPPRRHHLHGGGPDPSDMGALEVALLRRSLAGVADRIERCGQCHRAMLLGERVYEYASGAVRCELCRPAEGQAPAQSHRVHGPEFGHSIRVLDQRAAR